MQDIDGKVKVRKWFLKHPTAKIYLELMRYYEPVGSHTINYFNTNDMGGIRHVALEVDNVAEMFNFLSKNPDVKMVNDSEKYGPPKRLPSDFTLTFFTG